VWTTFNDFQWDLNYSNPAVFNSMAQEMLFLANQGAEVLRLDAVAFAWKKLGTTSESLPEVHLLVQAFNSLARLAAPALIFKSEAIVHPQEVNSYIHPGECQTSYNPLLMALLWESLATRKVALLNRSLQTYFNLPAGCTWVNYVRSHDDIGWTFSDEDAGALGINGYDHRRFLNAFYTGRFEGSFARGLPFQENPRTGDARISGTCASLAGLEQAIYEGEPDLAQLAIGRILLIHSIILSIGGIPLLYLGDEVGTLNDYNYRNHPAKAGDSRWVHRPASDWEQVALREDRDTYAGQIFQQLQALIRLRQKTAAFAGGETQFINTENPHVFAYTRHHQGERVLVLANFSEHSQRVGANLLRTQGLSYHFEALVTGESVSLGEDVVLGGYQFLWLRAV
jgi:amylosucrase